VGAYPTAERRAIVVLGCALHFASDGVLGGAAGRRAAEGARLFAELVETDAGLIVVASGGRAWGGLVEADGLARELTRRGVPDERIVRERLSLSTRENARYTGEALRTRGLARVVIVTCTWHVPRAAALFRREGLEVAARGAPDPRASLTARVWRWGRERVAAHLDGVSGEVRA
jgi:uncharacterized SAM-binding protein YcdF (DUF218 family)